MRLALLIGLCATGAVVGCTTPMPLSACTTSSDCAASQECVDRTCVPRPDAAATCDGACECTIDSDCRDTIPACADAACVGGTCFARPVDTRCSGGERCDPSLGCVGGTLDAGEAMDGAALDASASTDAPPAAIDVPPDAPLGALGDPCRTDAECAPVPGASGAARCLTLLGSVAFDGGYCSAGCVTGGMMGCGPDGACALPTAGGTFMPLCFRTCASSMECRAGYRCARIGFLAGSDVCAPSAL